MIRKIEKKLELNKVTVSNLELKNVQGGSSCCPIIVIETVTNDDARCCKEEFSIDPVCTMENCL